MADSVGGSGNKITAQDIQNLDKSKQSEGQVKLPADVIKALQNDSFALRNIESDSVAGFSKAEISAYLQVTYGTGEGTADKIAQLALDKAGGQINSGSELASALGVDTLEHTISEKIQDFFGGLFGKGGGSADGAKIDLLEVLVNGEVDIEVPPPPPSRAGRGGGRPQPEKPSVEEQVKNTDLPTFSDSDSVEVKNQKAAETLILLSDALNTDPNTSRRAGRGGVITNNADAKISKGEIEQLLQTLTESTDGNENTESAKKALEYLLNNADGQAFLQDLDQLDGNRRPGRGGARPPTSDGNIDISKLKANFGQDVQLLNEIADINTPEFDASASTEAKNEAAGKTLLLLVDQLNTEKSGRAGRGGGSNSADARISRAEIEALLTSLNELSEKGYEVDSSVTEALDYLLNDEDGKALFDSLDQRAGRGGPRTDGQIDVSRLEREYGTPPSPPSRNSDGPRGGR